MTASLLAAVLALPIAAGPGTGAALAATHRVPDAYPTIQAAVDSAAAGDTILVAPGIYRGPGNRGINPRGRDLVFLAPSGPDSTVIDCQFQGRGFFLSAGETVSTIIDGFRISRGQGDWGGGIYMKGAGATIRNCVVTGNRARYAGGGIYCWRETVAVIRNCEISANRVYGGYRVQDGGGGIACNEAAPRISNCRIEANTANLGGGGVMCWSESVPVFSHCIFAGNTAGEEGGAVTFRDLWLGARARFDHCTVVGNDALQAGGIFADTLAVIEIEESILWDDAPNEIVALGDSVRVADSIVSGGWNGEGILDVDPGFVDPAAGDYHLWLGSPASDAADPDSSDLCFPPSAGATRADLGAYGGPGACDWIEVCDRPQVVRPAEPTVWYWGDPPLIATWLIRTCAGKSFDFLVTPECGELLIDPEEGRVSPHEPAVVRMRIDPDYVEAGSLSCEISLFSSESSAPRPLALTTLRYDGRVTTPVEIEAADTPDSVAAGDSTSWEVAITNVSDRRRTVEAWIDLYYPNGLPFESNPVDGPFTFRPAPGQHFREIRTYVFPDWIAPSHLPYRVCNRVGIHGDRIWDEACFRLFVTAPDTASTVRRSPPPSGG